jgi:hypothetical protein
MKPKPKMGLGAKIGVVLASTPARVRPGYDVQQVDAFLDQTELMLAAMRAPT